ncbi:MAG: GNAT family N-acetyltransferase [Acidobacteriaceae bacterium]
MNIQIREFQPGDEIAFRSLNEAWITASFRLEAEDVATLGDPQHHILDAGGHIYFAVQPQTGEVLGCCALLAMEEGCFEVAKMAIAERFRRQGIGGQLLRGTIAEARSLGARRLYLVTHHSLKNAIGLYESEGFVHLRAEDAPPSPYARATVFMERFL